MYQLTKKCHDTLDLLEYSGDRVFNDSSRNGWTVGKTNKFISFGLSKQEGIEKWFLEILPDNPLRILCEKNNCIPHAWIRKNLTENEYELFLAWMAGQGQSEYGVYSNDVVRFLELNSL